MHTGGPACAAIQRPPGAVGLKTNLVIGALSMPLVVAIIAAPADFVASREEIADLTSASDTLGFILIGSKMLFLSAAIYALNLWRRETG